MPKQFKTPPVYDRIIGGDGCELTVCLPQAATDDPSGPLRSYACNADLPSDIRDLLPSVVQTLYREAYNHARGHVSGPVDAALAARYEDVARRAAWAAVRRLYVQHGTTWVRRKPA